MMKRKLLAMILAAGCVFIAPVAYAADYTFEINVDVAGVPASVTEVHVACDVYYDGGTARLGQGLTRQALGPSGFRGMLRVEVNVSRPPSPTAGRYSCRIFGISDGRAITFDTMSNPSSVAYNPAFARGASTRLETQANGPL